MPTERPYKIFDERKLRDLPWRAYKQADRAIERCLGLLWRLQIGNTFTVYDSRSSTAILQVTRKVSGLQFLEDKPGTLNNVLQGKLNL